jgi:hypothetical protein
LDKVKAIAAFVQQTKYLSIDLNLTKGGGYTPRNAETTLATNWGDCKDKATLMRALLKAAGIEAYPAAIFSGHRRFVKPEWASPTQFNHMIVAVNVKTGLTTSFDAPGIGPLLMFDPTDPFTPVGDLPEDEQGSYALVLAGAKGDLMQMPLRPADANRIETTVEGELDAAGQMKGKMTRLYHGQSGASPRAIQRLRGDEELKKRFERAIGRRVGEVTFEAFHPRNDAAQNEFSVNIDLTSSRLGQNMRDRLLMVRPGMLASAAEYGFDSDKRSSPIELDSAIRKDTIRLKIPAGFKPDEIPAPGRVETRFGVLEASWKVENGEILFEQTLEVRDTTAAASEFGDVEDFFAQVNGALSAPLVLARQ